MRRGHLDALRPVCPACRRPDDDAAPLALDRVALASPGGDDVLEGTLACGRCRREFPIVDGVPLLVPDLPTFVRNNQQALLQREDLGELAEGVLGDCLGPGSAFDVSRLHLSSYAWDHWGDLDVGAPGERPWAREDAPPGGLRRLLQRGLALAGPGPRGHAIDVGCGPGRTLFDLAARDDVDLVLGVDLHVPMLRLASAAVRRGVVRWPRREVGLVHTRREARVDLPGREKVDVWCCDAAALPFRQGTFALGAGMNLVDSAAAPLQLLGALSHVLRLDGRAVLSSPYDWAGVATPAEAWIGGHGARGPLGGDSAALLRVALSPAGHPGAQGLELEAEEDGVPWAVRMHARATMRYRCHLVAARVRPPAPAATPSRAGAP